MDREDVKHTHWGVFHRDEDVLPSSATWRNQGDMMPGKQARQRQKLIISLTRRVLKKKRTHRNRMVVTRGWGKKGDAARVQSLP